MTTTYKKKLIEVAIPLEAINVASAREKSIRHGHPSTLHLWWARRPLAACRAILFAQLVDDPSSHPDQFPTHDEQEAERKRLFKIIEDLVLWENSTNEEVLERARAEIRKSCGGELPPVYDPFSGGGSIPLEAQRLGLPAYGSDLNPVAVMIGKAMIEIPPRFKDMPPIHPGIKERSFYRNAEGLAEDIKYYGAWMRQKAKERIGSYYPQIDVPKSLGGGTATVVAWIWSRTVPSPDPAFADVQVPIASSFLLSSKSGEETWIQPVVNKADRTIKYVIRKGGTKAEIASAKEGTKLQRANFKCLMSETAITADYVKAAGKAGKMGQSLLAIIAERRGGRVYIEPNAEHINRAFAPEIVKVAKECRDTFLNGETPARLTGGTCHGYGLDQWGKLFTDRQIFGLSTFSDLVQEAREEIEADALASGKQADGVQLQHGGAGARAYAEAVSVYLAFAIDRMADAGSTIATWAHSGFIRFTFARQAIPMTWDFAECNFLSDSTGNFGGAIEWIFKAISEFQPRNIGSLRQQDAQQVVLPESAVISTDPPYYDNIAYADLSDFFYVWLRRATKSVFPELTAVLAVPKAEELVAVAYRHGSKIEAEDFFLSGMTQAITSLALQSSADFPATIYYAFKQSEVEQEGLSSTGWATFLQAVINSGYIIVGTWPVRTERAARTVASGTNALANSVVLVCRKKEASAELITRAEFIRALKRELPPAIAELQTANIAPADMPQSAIGPGMGVFTRYKAVLESDDRPMSVKTALQLINRELDEYLGGIQGEFDADTRFAITWFEQKGLNAGDFGIAQSIATARGITVESVKHAGIVESSAGKVRILNREELDPDWHPNEDKHLTIWECLQHLVQSHENQGLSDATAIRLQQIGDKAEAVKDLAYCLYDIAANKRKDAKEATAYNALIADWTELSRMAATVHDTSGRTQLRFDV
jgi:putative DNA methylase